MDKQETIKPDPGVFLIKGDKFGIPGFSISIDDKGNILVPPIDLHTGVVMTPFWLQIAKVHVSNCLKIHNKLMEAKVDKNNELIAKYLQKEFLYGMQAIISSAIAIDSFYSIVVGHTAIPEATKKAWQKNGTARYKQISETLKVGLNLTNDSAKSLRDSIKKIFEIRDKAVHPKSGTDTPLFHVELNKVTDWRYALFRFSNAKNVYGSSLSIIFQCSSKVSKKVNSDLSGQLKDISTAIKPQLKSWNRRYGKLF